MRTLQGLLILLLTASLAQGQSGIDIQTMNIPSIAWKALSFLASWQSTKNNKENDSGISFAADHSWKMITEAYAFDSSTNTVYIYSAPDGEKNKVWGEFATGVNSFGPTALSSIYAYTDTDDILYIEQDGSATNSGLCSEMYSLSVMGVSLYGIFDNCILATKGLYKLNVDTQTPEAIADIEGVSVSDIVDISADALGGAYAVDVDGNAYHYDADADAWTQILANEDPKPFIVQVAANTFENSVWLLVDSKDGAGSSTDNDFQIFMYDTEEDSKMKFTNFKKADNIEVSYFLGASAVDSEGVVYYVDIVLFFFLSIGNIVDSKLAEMLGGLV